ncbi:hypothetical protein [Fredinandcohnia quinoae]|uniref:Lipoprotein n=1 Tax=Fredinandcohnia quinoae TaxID=2918902 RepID=A0AAW5EGH7_9BACI|nr:hypothetical protein [Fredinandcohnia sp. SECRCQ15]MCH1627984.1 hypothetical protein [Fredinandcohnia sp. SECRCQ15]
MKKLIVILLSLFLTACQQQKTNLLTSQIDSSTIEHPTETTNKIVSLHLIDSNGQKYIVPIHSIPEFEQYLSEIEDPLLELERTSYNFLNIESESEKYVAFQYSCGNKLCSTILIKIVESDITSFPIGYGILMDYKQSPSNKNVIFRFGVNEGGGVLRNNLVVIDLKMLKPLSSPSVDTEQYFNDPQWPITEYGWINDEEFMIQIADIENSDYETLLKWSEGERSTKEVLISLKNN